MENCLCGKHEFDVIYGQAQKIIRNSLLFEKGQISTYSALELCWYLLSLIDGYDLISEQVFEHYKTIEMEYRKMLRYLIPLIEHLDVKCRMLVAYAILKGCRLEAILDEKYANLGIDIWNNMKHDEELHDNQEYDAVTEGARLLLYSEVLKRDKQ